MKTTFALITFSLFTLIGHTQEAPIKTNSLQEVIINSTRIDLPFKENSRTIDVITSEDIKNSAATNVADLLQQVAGVDIRRRGTAGSQADVYIRGGNYNQTLLLIDGIKMDDAQTGHHTMNAALPIEVIERIEVIKGPAARIFGQNAFTGAINIVTKKNLNNTVSTNIETGSFGQLNGSVTVGNNLEDSSYILHAGKLTSEGYRSNTDYDNTNLFFKNIFNKKTQPIELIATFFDKKFGAQDFYTNSGFTEYEETQNSLIGLTSTFKKSKLKIKPRVYWKRNQDEFLLRREDPSFSRNFHITNKIGVETNASYVSQLGTTGFGIDLSKIYLRSNSLGNRNRFMTTLFLEHQFKFINDKLDITPGVAATYFSDFKFHAFPGFDIGYRFNERFKIYGNAGYTYRIPTYTELYITIPTRLEGNKDLNPEEAISVEVGGKFNYQKFNASAALFYRNTDNLIDYSRNNLSDPLVATNLPGEISSKGLEINTNYLFKINTISNNLSLGYTFIEDEVKDLNLNFLRYSVNSLKHQFTSRLNSKITKNLNVNLIYRHAERTSGLSYNVWDTSMIYSIKNLEFTLTANNIFDENYVEQGVIPMPPSNVLFGFRYSFN